MYECMWIFIAGSFLGYVIEMLWYRKLRGRWICRKGVIYGMFSPIYGIAFVGFSKIAGKVSNILSTFILGSLLGSMFEYLCGYLQEKILGTKSWDYSKKPFQLHGRICLEFALYWGITAVVVVYVLQPCFLYIYSLFPIVFGRRIVTGGFVLLVCDCIISGLACMQQRNRRQGNRINNCFTRFLDRHYSDERLAEIFTETRIV